MSPEPSHAVVPLEPCAHSYPCSDSFERPPKSRCSGCTHNGLRAVLDQAVSVTFRIIDGKTFAIEEDDIECWVER